MQCPITGYRRVSYSLEGIQRVSRILSILHYFLSFCNNLLLIQICTTHIHLFQLKSLVFLCLVQQ